MKSNRSETKFKQTEIGLIPETWEVARIIDIADKDSDIVAGPFGSNLKVEDYVDEGVPIIRLQNIDRYHFIDRDIKCTTEAKYEELKYHSFRAGDIVLAKLGMPIGKACMVPDEFSKGIVVADVVRIRISANNIDSYYLLCVLNSDSIKNQLSSRQVGTTRPRVNLSDVRELLIPIPPLSEQHRIAKIFSSINSKIELNDRMNRTLERIGEGLFKSWFVAFEFPNNEGKPYKSSGGQMTYSEDLEKQVPRGWRISEVGKEIDVGGGSTPSTIEESYWKDGDINWATPKDMSSLSFPVLIDTERKITKEGLLAIGSREYPRGTLLMSSRAPVGYLAIADIPTSINQGIIAMICSQAISNNFMLNWCKTNMESIENRANGTVFKEISKSNFRSMTILVPPKSILSLYDAYMEPIYSKMASNVRQTNTLERIRDLLLPRLVSGRIRIPAEVS